MALNVFSFQIPLRKIYFIKEKTQKWVSSFKNVSTMFWILFLFKFCKSFWQNECFFKFKRSIFRFLHFFFSVFQIRVSYEKLDMAFRSLNSLFQSSCYQNDGSFWGMKFLHDLVGTPYYTAPEVIEGNYTHSADIWSIGVVMVIILYLNGNISNFIIWMSLFQFLDTHRFTSTQRSGDI